MFAIKPKHHEVKLVAAHKVSTIFLTKGTLVSTDAMLLALANEVKIIFLDGIGRAQGFVWNGKFGSISTIRKNQALFAQHPAGMDWIRKVAIAKMRTQIEHLQMYFSTHAHHAATLQNTIQQIQKFIGQLQSLDVILEWQKGSLASLIRGTEGVASREYFQALSTLLPVYYQFSERSRKPAKDFFNCVLNYLYGMLYAMVELALIRAGVDPHLGVLHADEYNKPTMVFDFIEPFRYWADQVAMQLFLKEELGHDCFERKDNGFWLGQTGKPIVVQAMNQWMEETIAFQKRIRKRSTHLDLEAQQLAQELLHLQFPTMSNGSI